MSQKLLVQRVQRRRERLQMLRRQYGTKLWIGNLQPGITAEQLATEFQLATGFHPLAGSVTVRDLSKVRASVYSYMFAENEQQRSKEPQLDESNESKGQ